MGNYFCEATRSTSSPPFLISCYIVKSTPVLVTLALLLPSGRMAIDCQLSSQLIVLSSFLIYQVSYSICFYAESKWDKVGNVERLQKNPKEKKKKKQRVSDKIFDSYGLLLS